MIATHRASAVSECAGGVTMGGNRQFMRKISKAIEQVQAQQGYLEAQASMRNASMKIKEIIQELSKFDWFRELPELKKTSKQMTVLRKEDRKLAPVSRVLELMEETMSRPEIWNAYASAPIDGQIRGIHRNIIHAYATCFWHKYGNNPDLFFSGANRMLACGEFTGIDDPKLREYLLLDKGFVYDDGEIR
ncbi:MAG: hypothetical protein R3C97_10620 [Geminicoccaceae bacterium]